MRQTILHLIRHGQTDWNAQNRLQGQIDIPLNTFGIAEAEKMSRDFKGYPISAVYSSPLQRAYATAQIVNIPHQRAIKTYDALKEASYGPLEGVTREEYHRRCLSTLAYFEQLSPEDRLHFKPVPEAESYFEVYQRAHPCIDEILQNHTGERVVVVSHGGLMKGFIAVVTKHDVRNIHVQNLGCVTFIGDKTGLSIQSYTGIEIGRGT